MRRVIDVVAGSPDLLPEGIRILPASLNPRLLALLHEHHNGRRHDCFRRSPFGQA
jgi:hypothetical protein